MILNLAQWLTRKNIAMWKWVWNKGFLMLILLFIPIGYLSVMMLMFSLIFYVLSWVAILEKAATSMFRFTKAKMRDSKIIGKILYLPLFLISVMFYGFVFVVSLGSAASDFGGNK